MNGYCYFILGMLVLAAGYFTYGRVLERIFQPDSERRDTGRGVHGRRGLRGHAALAHLPDSIAEHRRLGPISEP